MKSPNRSIPLLAQLALAIGALCAASAAAAATRGAAAADAQYRSERAACLSGQSQQDRTTCLREAAAARDEARRNRLDDGAGADYQRNALARCDVQPAAERDACRALARGEGVSRGSAEQGGIIRERTTIVPAPAR